MSFQGVPEKDVENYAPYDAVDDLTGTSKPVPHYVNEAHMAPDYYSQPDRSTREVTVKKNKNVWPSLLLNFVVFLVISVIVSVVFAVASQEQQPLDHVKCLVPTLDFNHLGVAVSLNLLVLYCMYNVMQNDDKYTGGVLHDLTTFYTSVDFVIIFALILFLGYGLYYSWGCYNEKLPSKKDWVLRL